MSGVFVYGANFHGSIISFSNFLNKRKFDKLPSLILDSNIAGRYSHNKEIICNLNVDVITVFAEIENAYNKNIKEIQDSKFELQGSNDEIRKIKNTLYNEYKRMFNDKLIDIYVEFINGIPRFNKGTKNLVKVESLINYYNSNKNKRKINFMILLCLINIYLNCDKNDFCKKLLHYPQVQYTPKLVRNFVYDLFIIDEVNRLINEGVNVFFCTGDFGAYNLCVYINKLTKAISFNNLNSDFYKKGFYGIEKVIYENILDDTNLNEIIGLIRKEIYSYWTGSKNQKQELKLNPIVEAIYYEYYKN
ncbi:hypothetical protein [Providencia alcalifaciens]|uniref:hypothetical protein n=1 Tax=Providencia alcalifaciens TaxID=126385 RepID=UPI00029BAA5E|nr:hypothetical protein [Providencia alcalifaciens]EKT61724.1 hypothetical protein OO9_19505 [Providencia alcalifaciens Dmel2]